MKIKSVIIEDEPFALKLMEGFVGMSENLELKGAFSNPVKGFEFLRKEQIDLVFLDINMPDMSGLEISHLVKDDVKIIFTTAYKDYALEGFKVNAIDYLLKPFDFEEFSEAVKKAEIYFQMVISKELLYEEEIIVRADHKQYKVRPSEILFVENVKNYVIFRLLDGTKIMALMSLKSLIETLPNYFSKVHRSFVVNVNFIEESSSNTIRIKSFDIPISESHRKDFRNLMNERSIN